MANKKETTKLSIDSVIDDLRGTTKSITQVLPGYMKERDLAPAQLRKIKTTIDVCAGCGTWVNIDELNEHDHCFSCNEESLMDDDEN